MPAVKATNLDVLEVAEQLAASLGEGASHRDQERDFPLKELQAVKDSNLPLLFVPENAGGLGGTVGDFIRIVQRLAAGDPNVAQMFLVHSFFTRFLMTMAQGDVLADWQRRLREDRIWVANAYTERGTKTIFDYNTAIRANDDGTWALTGTKFYCTGSLAADVIGISCVIEGRPRVEETDFNVAYVEATAPGVNIIDDWVGMGQRTTASGTIEFKDVVVSPGNCFGTKVFAEPDSVFGLIGQGGFAAIYTGIARAALDAGIHWAQERARPWPHSGVDQASEDPYVMLRVGEMATLVSSAEATLDHAANLCDQLEADRTEDRRARAAIAVSEAKAHATQVSLAVSETIFQVAGASATLEKYNLNRFWRDARTLTIHDPVDYKYRLIGDYLLNSALPPVTAFS